MDNFNKSIQLLIKNPFSLLQSIGYNFLIAILIGVIGFVSIFNPITLFVFIMAYSFFGLPLLIIFNVKVINDLFINKVDVTFKGLLESSFNEAKEKWISYVLVNIVFLLIFLVILIFIVLFGGLTVISLINLDSFSSVSLFLLAINSYLYTYALYGLAIGIEKYLSFAFKNIIVCLLFGFIYLFIITLTGNLPFISSILSILFGYFVSIKILLDIKDEKNKL